MISRTSRGEIERSPDPLGRSSDEAVGAGAAGCGPTVAATAGGGAAPTGAGAGGVAGGVEGRVVATAGGDGRSAGAFSGGVFSGIDTGSIAARGGGSGTSSGTAAADRACAVAHADTDRPQMMQSSRRLMSGINITPRAEAVEMSCLARRSTPPRFRRREAGQSGTPSTSRCHCRRIWS